MAILKIFKEISLPASPELNAMYLVANPANPNHLEIFVTGNSADNVKHIVSKTEVDAAIATAIAGLEVGGNELTFEVVADIDARDALVLTKNTLVLVTDASADATVDSGAASYVYVAATSSYSKIAEYESMDVVQTWANLQDKPASTTAEIDGAVSASHTHANQADVLDKLSVVGGKLQFNGAPVDTGSIELASNAW